MHTTSAPTVGAFLREAGVQLGPLDEVMPLPSTRLADITSDNPGASPEIVVVRVEEAQETIPESIPFERRVIRSASLAPEDPPRLLQVGQPGLQQVTVQIVFRDGLEAERRRTAVEIIEPPQDEIVMVGVGATRETMPITGTLAYIDDGRAVVMRSNTANRRQLNVEGQLDGRVFQLSPDGRYLLYTVAETASDRSDARQFRNSLWLIETGRGTQPRPLNIENVLWAGWDPGRADMPRIAYTTARSTSLPPGWEAINDLWLLEVSPDEAAVSLPVRLIETYPATYGWWGGQYAWSPDGGQIAYAFADEVGVIAVPTPEEAAAIVPGRSDNLAGSERETRRRPIFRFTEYDTRSDWAWIPAVSWSADGRLLFTTHAGDNPLSAEKFDLWTATADGALQVPLRPGVGMWSFNQPSPRPDSGQLAFLQASDPADSRLSAYTLWLMDADGSNDRLFYPTTGQSGLFLPVPQFMAWEPDGNRMAFIFDDALHVYDLTEDRVYRATDDDTRSSRPTWAPYGAARSDD